MKNLFKVIICLLLLYLVSAYSPSKTTDKFVIDTTIGNNLDFELGNLNGWVISGSVSVGEINVKNGNYAVQVGLNGNLGSISRVISGLKPNTEYTLGAWAKCTGGKLLVKAENFGGVTVQQSTTSSSYKQMLLTFLTGPNDSSVLLNAWTSTATPLSSGFFDDFAITETVPVFPDPSKWYALESRINGRYLGNKTETNDAQIWPANPTIFRQYRFEVSAVSGYYNIISRINGRFLGNQTQTGDAVFWPATDTDFRRWALQSSGVNDFYNLVSKIDGKYLANKTDTNDAVVWSANDSDYRRWKLVEVDDVIVTQPTPTGLWDTSELFQTPNYRVVNRSNVWSIVYEGPEFKGIKREVFAYYSNPAILSGTMGSGVEYPAIVLVHGGTGRAFKEWVLKWANDGYAALAIDFSATDGLMDFVLPAGPVPNIDTQYNAISEGPDATWSYFSVGSIMKGHSLLMNLPGVDADRTGITGISWGGYLTTLVAGLDNRFKAAVPVYGCGFFEEVQGAKGSLNNLGDVLKQQWLDYLDPKQYIQAVDYPMLFINGNKDFFFDIPAFDKTFQLVNPSYANIKITPDMPHSHIAGWAPPEIKFFFDSIFNSGNSLGKVQNVVVTSASVSANLIAPSTINSAVLYYTTDQTSLNKNKIWKKINGSISGNDMNFSIPSGAYMAFIYVRDSRGLGLSSSLLFPRNASVQSKATFTEMTQPKGDSIFGNNFSVYPNPFTTRLNILSVTESEVIHTIKLIDLEGRVVEDFRELERNSDSENGSTNYNLDTSNLKKGIYFFTIQNREKSKVMKLIKE